MLCYWAVDQSFKRQSGEIDKRGRRRDHGQGDIEREMQGDEARILLGFSPGSRPSPSQVKEAYKRKVWDSHPDLFPAHQKSQAESKFKLISEAYSFLLSGARRGDSHSASYERVVRRGVPVSQGGRRNHALIKLPFLLLILGTVSLGGLNVSRAYKRQKEAYPSHNPFLP